MLKEKPKQAATMAAKFKLALEHAPHVKASIVAAKCHVTAQAVNGWGKTGRISKNHLPIIAELTGTSLAWWLDGNASSPIKETAISHAAGHHKAQEELPLYAVRTDINRLVTAYETMLQAERDKFLHDMEVEAERVRMVTQELHARSSVAAHAFKPAVSDAEVARKMKAKKAET